MSKGALYHYFAGKEDLFAAIVIAALEQLIERARRSMSGVEGAAARLRAFAVGQAELFETEAPGCRVAMSRFASRIDFGDAQARVDQLRRRYVATLQRLFASGVASGEFADVDVRAATRMMLAVLYWLARWYEPSGSNSAAAIAAAHADIMLKGILA